MDLLSPRDLVRTADLDRILAQASGADTVAALAARRVLASLGVNAGFYKPREFLAAGRPEHALRALEVAYRVRGSAEGLCRWWPRIPEAMCVSAAELDAACREPAGDEPGM